MGVILAIHTRHDANVCIADTTRIQFLELEKHTGKRYFAFSKTPEEFRRELEELVLPCLAGQTPKEVLYSWLEPGQLEVLRAVFPNTKRFRGESHHVCHVHSNQWFTQLSEDDLIVSYDGGGDLNDTFKVFRWSGSFPLLIGEERLNLGSAYRMLGYLCPEISSAGSPGYGQGMELAGKVMALGAFGRVREEWRPALERYYRSFKQVHPMDSLKQLGATCSMDATKGWGTQGYRDLQATSQAVFEQFFVDAVYPLLQDESVKRVVVVGGCALNVLMNTRIHRDTGLPVFVAPCPNDSGISLGLLARFHPELIGHGNVSTEPGEDLTGKWQCDRDEMNGLLAAGHVVATFLPEIEIGPRALGMRSLLADPFVEGIRDRLNRMKEREWFRPVAPVLTEEAAGRYFEPCPASPFMSFAPRVRPEFRAEFNELVHVDGTARIQSVGPGHWMHALLQKHGELRGHEVLLNTSFNAKGRPLVNDILEARSLAQRQGVDALVTPQGIELIGANIPTP
jgi:carbamoyltransferase